ncbi:hypothetical protein B0H11DRAFT_2385471 [Mycena galericulata]|nr:hypothetical protein B0H11DRAFT_2385471 [Mycena galericulata]
MPIVALTAGNAFKSPSLFLSYRFDRDWRINADAPPRCVDSHLILGAVRAHLSRPRRPHSLIADSNRASMPPLRLGRLNTAITATTETLMRAKSTSELGASKVQTRLLKLAVRDSGSEPERSKTWMAYLQEMHKISQALTESEIQIREAETSILLTIEAERQRKLGKDINETREIADIMVQPAGGTTRNF